MKRGREAISIISRKGTTSSPLVSPLAVVAHLGGLTSFTHLAGISMFGDAHFVPCDTISCVFDSVQSGASELGIVPIESSTAGSFFTTLDELLHSAETLEIVGEKTMKEKLALCVQQNIRETDIDRVVAHPHVLECCSEYLRLLDRRRCSANTAKLERIPSLDSTKSCETVSTETDTISAAISNRETAERYGLTILADHVGSDLNGQTRYIVISKRNRITNAPRGAVAQPWQMRTSLVFGCPNVPSAIFKWSSCFALRNINILKVECRPATTVMTLRTDQRVKFPLRHFEFVFYVDFETAMDETTNAALISNLRERDFTLFLIELGTYSSDTSSQATAVANPIWDSGVFRY